MSMFQIINNTEEQPYSKPIRQFLFTQFPQRLCEDPCDLVDLITNEIFASKAVRYGPKPSVESQVAIRDVIRHYVSLGQPIPFMVPWGSEKPDGGGIDLAELSALKMIHCLQNRVSVHYAPGAKFNVRIEDASAPHLFYDHAEEARKNANYYSTNFANLVYVLELDGFIKPVRESSLVSEARFNEEADLVLPAMEKYVTAAITSTDEAKAMTDLVSLGWKGNITAETRNFYLGQYAKLYPNKSITERGYILARYYAAALARARLKIRGDDPAWGGKFIDLSFLAPIPGTEGYFNRRVHYRTIPSNLTSNHMAPWRAKGYLTIDESEVATPKLASFHEQQEYNQYCLHLKRDDVVAVLQADYVAV